MPTSLESHARQSLFVLKKHPVTQKLKLPLDWVTALINTTDELVSCVHQGYAHQQWIVVVVEQSDFQPTLETLRTRLPEDMLAKTGLVVLSDNPEPFLRSHSSTGELLDVVPKSAVKNFTPFVLLNSVRKLCERTNRELSAIDHKTLERLNEIFIALSAEREPQRLLSMILANAMHLTSANAGALYMLQEKDGELNIRLRIAGNETTRMELIHLNAKVNENSISGYVALTGKLLNIADVDMLKPHVIPSFNKAIDYDLKGTTRAVLTAPLKNSRKELVGVLQLINKSKPNGKETTVAGFNAADESLISSYSTQAAICLENVELYGDIKRLFDGFVKASITAIESRDPSTGGHSERVAKMTVALAIATTQCDRGVYRSVRFKEEEIRELEYAALLHDFGKIGVREEVLIKAKKLQAYQLEAIKERLKIFKAAARIDYMERKFERGANEVQLERELQQRLRELEDYWNIIQTVNEPTVLKQESKKALEQIRTESILLPDRTKIHLLNDDEYQALAVEIGSLTAGERLEIESHVRHTYQFLKMIPWTRDFQHLPDIAYAHHEKLDGSGYPRGLTSHEIPLQSKIMTIADIYDALTAADRWYKDAVPSEKAIEILAQDVAEGRLDPILFELFVEKKIYQLTHPKSKHQVVA
ncbi:MAG: GAF domain-containing protein [Deltaproteobacteria bacterium]|nr:GAF domain-containing protein [Deltaproteobacteria bacterium]